LKEKAIMNPRVRMGDDGRPISYEWTVRHGNMTSLVSISAVSFDRLSENDKKRVLKMELIKAYTRMISEMINIV
jgi:hypothetical protein